MPRVTDIALIETADQPVLCIRTQSSMTQLPQLIGSAYGKLAAYLGELDTSPSDIPYVCYRNMDMEHLNLEIGFPVAKSLPDREDMISAMIPAGKYVFCIYRGPYQDMPPVYQEINDWIDTHQMHPTGIVYECYLNGPTVPPEELLTKIVFQLM